jgi:NAD(P)-dependent dehydrogenase (short-subunit alcohol dehydrogenase family)
MRRFEDKIAIVTGGASGIGAATAARLAAEGAMVVVADVADPPPERRSPNIAYQHCDVASLADWQALASETVRQFGKIDVVHNNAYAVVIGPTHELAEEEWDRQIDVCLKQVFLSVKTCMPQLLAVGGTIVNTSSVHALIGYLGYSAYDAAKGGVCSLTRQLAAEYGPRVRVNSVLPGAIATPAWDDLPTSARESAIENAPAKRLGTPEEVAAAVCFLASDEAAFITGAALVVDGGWTITKE